MTATQLLSKVRELRRRFENGEDPNGQPPRPEGLFTGDDVKRLKRDKDEVLETLVEDLVEAFDEYEESESEVYHLLDVLEQLATGRIAIAEIEKQQEAASPPVPVTESMESRGLHSGPLFAIPPNKVKDEE